MKKLFVVVTLLLLTSLVYAQSSSVGGYLCRVKNLSGIRMYRGWLVVGCSTSAVTGPPTTGVSFYTEIDTCPKNVLYPIGTVYSDSIENNGFGLITTHGRGYVAVQYNRTNTVIPGNRILFVSADSAKKADCVVSTSVPDHYKEIGHPVTKMYGKNANGDSLCIGDLDKL